MAALKDSGFTDINMDDKQDNWHHISDYLCHCLKMRFYGSYQVSYSRGLAVSLFFMLRPSQEKNMSKPQSEADVLAKRQESLLTVDPAQEKNIDTVIVAVRYVDGTVLAADFQETDRGTGDNDKAEKIHWYTMVYHVREQTVWSVVKTHCAEQN